MLTVCCSVVLLSMSAAVQARGVSVRIARVSTPVATLNHVRMHVNWDDAASTGTLQIWAAEVTAAELGYHGRDLYWRCPLQRSARGGWQCEGQLLAAHARPLQLAVQLDAATTKASLTQGATRLGLNRSAATPDLTAIDLHNVPIAWAQALLTSAWPAAQIQAGTLDGQVLVHTPSKQPLGISANVRVAGLGLQTRDASIVGEGLGAAVRVDYQGGDQSTIVAVDAALQGGEFLFGNTYVALPARHVGVQVRAHQQGHDGWQLAHFGWEDGAALTLSGTAAWLPDGTLQTAAMQATSRDLAPVKARYLSGWMGLFGLSEVALQGGADIRVQVRDGELAEVDGTLHNVNLRDPNERFVFDGLQGDLRYSSSSLVTSALQWHAGKLYGLAFGSARLPFSSSAGELRIPGRVVVPMLGGQLDVLNTTIRPPQGDAGLRVAFGLQLDDIDFGQVSHALDLPAFQGRLSGVIPRARYADDRIDFDGGLNLHIFDGKVAMSDLVLERPFGTAPSLSADIAMDGLDLMRLTEVMGFGSISGKLDGRISGLRLVGWTPVAFNARFITDDAPGVRKRISQRAVQDISSVGGGGLLQSLQGQVVSLFDDFGYRRIGIGCRLEAQVCVMSGLHSGNNAFTIVEGAGVPRLTVVGFNRVVDWPTLVERLVAAGKGEVTPVVD